MVAALKRAVLLRRSMRTRDLRIAASGCARSPAESVAGTPTPDDAAVPERGLTARELIRMAQAARRARQQ